MSATPPTEATDAAPQAPVADAPRAARRFAFRFDPRFLAPVLITCILLGGHLSFGILESWRHTLLAIGSAMLLELVLTRFMLGRWPHLASAYITGISVGILIRSPALWPYAMCASLSICSKYVLRWRDRHLWNPSNFGVSVMVLLYASHVATLTIQWGNEIWAMLVIWLLGSIIILRINRFHITATYVVSFIAFSAVRSAITGTAFLTSVAPLTGPMYQLFVFFMITDPKTTVKGFLAQCLVAFLVAVVEMVIRLGGHYHWYDPVIGIHAPYFALFLVGPPHRENRATLGRLAGGPRVCEVPPFEPLDTHALDGWLAAHDLTGLAEGR